MAVTINYNGDHNNGIVKYIREKHSDSIYDYIHVDYSSLLEGDEKRKPYAPLGIDNPNGEYSFHSENVNNSWYQVTLNYRIKPTSYSIKSYDQNYPQCWSFDASENGIKWDMLQFKDKNNELSSIKNYELESSSYYSIFRFTSIGERHTIENNHDFYLEIFHFEIFGELRPKHSCQTIQQILPIYYTNLVVYSYILFVFH